MYTKYLENTCCLEVESFISLRNCSLKKHQLQCSIGTQTWFFSGIISKSPLRHIFRAVKIIIILEFFCIYFLSISGHMVMIIACEQ